ncbi:MAG: DMT family transporter [Bacillota bacterium]|nr:DMT family transporter [Bacillota bacterium]
MNSISSGTGKSRSLLPYYGALILCIFIWATVPIATKAGIDSFGPITFAWIRGFTGFLLVLPFAVKRGMKIRNMFTPRAMFYGLMAFVLNTMLMTVGMQWCSANVSSILQATMPVFMLIGGVLFLSEKLTLWKGLGAVTATAGIVITCLGGSIIDENTTLSGILIVATAPLTWTVYSIYMKKKDSGTDPVIITAYLLGCGSLLSLPLLFGELAFVTGFPDASAGAWMVSVYAGFVCLGIGNLMWNIGVSNIDASITGLFYNTCPIIGVILSIFYGETVSLLQAGGCAVVIIGVLLGMKDELKPKKVPALQD